MCNYSKLRMSEIHDCRISVSKKITTTATNRTKQSKNQTNEQKTNKKKTKTATTKIHAYAHTSLNNY